MSTVPPPKVHGGSTVTASRCDMRPRACGQRLRHDVRAFCGRVEIDARGTRAHKNAAIEEPCARAPGGRIACCPTSARPTPCSARSSPCPPASPAAGRNGRPAGRTATGRAEGQHEHGPAQAGRAPGALAIAGARAVAETRGSLAVRQQQRRAPRATRPCSAPGPHGVTSGRVGRLWHRPFSRQVPVDDAEGMVGHGTPHRWRPGHDDFT